MKYELNEIVCIKKSWQTFNSKNFTQKDGDDLNLIEESLEELYFYKGKIVSINVDEKGEFLNYDVLVSFQFENINPFKKILLKSLNIYREPTILRKVSEPNILFSVGTKNDGQIAEKCARLVEETLRQVRGEFLHHNPTFLDNFSYPILSMPNENIVKENFNLFSIYRYIVLPDFNLGEFQHIKILNIHPLDPSKATISTTVKKFSSKTLHELDILKFTKENASSLIYRKYLR